MDAEFFRKLFRYNQWANDFVLSKASDVAEADYHAPAPGLSFGSLHATPRAPAVAEVVWLARFNREVSPEALSDARRSHEIAANQLPTSKRSRRLGLPTKTDSSATSRR